MNLSAPPIDGRRSLVLLLDVSHEAWREDTCEVIAAFCAQDDLTLVIWVGARDPETVVEHLLPQAQQPGAPHLVALLEPPEALQPLIETVDGVAARAGTPLAGLAQSWGRECLPPFAPALRLFAEQRLRPELLDRRADDWRPPLRPMTKATPPGSLRTSILIPTYNRLAGLEECLRSVLSQDADDCEIVISDNASTDGTWECVQDLAGGDPRVRLRRNAENLGWTRNMEALLDASTGPLVKFVFSDDILAPGAIQRLREPLLLEPGVSISTGPWRMIDGEGLPIEDIPECSLPLPPGVIVPGREVIRLLFSRSANFVGSHTVPMLRREALRPKPGQSARWSTVPWAFDLGNWLDALRLGDLAYIGGEPVLAFRNPPRPLEALAARVCGIYGDMWDLLEEALDAGLLSPAEAQRGLGTFLSLVVPARSAFSAHDAEGRLEAAAWAAAGLFKASRSLEE